ncbi:AraC family transcriptional regulator [Paenibacillus agricola]|uniref:AraC family transcriptional regulator n=1 Tax=Paenibacillus agricola TaxID=2716264 RepID=A0ABX0J0Q4_9BACL|nr:AraC family transcriptional regulator [Paenibacillus agricola]NHN29717.1 AraC family transcriptional regulator [Paenibacillus agricola]
MVKQTIFVSLGEQFFNETTPIFVNRVAESFRLGIHSHDFYEICYVGEGAGFHFIGGQCFPVRKGDVTFIPIGVPHVFRPESSTNKSKLIVYNCLFTEEAVTHMRTIMAADPSSWLLAEAKGNQWLRHREERDEFERIFTFLYEAFVAKKPGWQLVLYGGVLQLNGLLFKKASQEPEGLLPTQLSDNEPVDQVVALMESDFSSPLTAASVASTVGVSERHLSRLVRKRTGMTFLELLQHLRIREACFLLRETSFKVSDIASRAGYQDIKFFNRLFKNKMGITPRQYREPYKINKASIEPPATVKITV